MYLCKVNCNAKHKNLTYMYFFVCSEVGDTSKQAYKNKQTQKMKECHDKNIAGEWKSLLEDESALKIIRKSLKTMKNHLSKVQACSQLREWSSEMRQKIEHLLHTEHADAESEAVRRQLVQDLHALAHKYEIKYYQTCIRETAQQIVVIMATDISNPSASFPVARCYIEKSLEHTHLQNLVLNTVDELRTHKCDNVLVISYDQEFVDFHSTDTQGRALNVLHLRKECYLEAQLTDRIKDTEKRKSCVQKILDHVVEVLGENSGVLLTQQDLLQHVSGIDMSDAMKAAALQTDTNLQRLAQLMETCEDVDVKRALLAINDVLLNKHLIACERPAKVNLNKATVEVICKQLKGVTKAQAQEILQARDAKGSPLEGIHELRPDVQNALLDQRNTCRYQFEGEMVTPPVQRSPRPLQDLRDILARLLFVKKIREIRALPARPCIPDNAGRLQTFAGGIDFSATPNSRVRHNFVRPLWGPNKHSPLWLLPCWVHVTKRPRCAIARGRFKHATPDQKMYYNAYKKVVLQTNQVYLTMVELDGSNEMSVPICMKMFSEWAVVSLRAVGEHDTADFADHMRMFFHSCNKRGLTLEARREMWQEVYEWLMNMEDIFNIGEYVKGMTRTSWESMLVDLSSLIQICDYLKLNDARAYKAFNMRSVNNDPIENFFGCLGYHTKAQDQIIYHDVKVEAAKRTRPGLPYAMPLSTRKFFCC
jgi:DNA uptake protein ComE-like DNA-binding protein